MSRASFVRARAAALTTIVLTVGLLVSAPVAGAQTVIPPDLAGENFFASGVTFETDPDALITTAYRCDESGGSATFTATGPATGPYPGTFTEEMTVTLGPGSVGTRAIVSIEATFSIDSPVAQVSGTKSFDPTIVPGRFDTLGAGCTADSGDWFVRELYAITPRLAYSALITTADGTFADFGTATLFYSTFLVVEGPQTGMTVDGFEETFRSDGVAPVLALPTDVDQCKDGGYARFGFKNQGECVRYIVTNKR